MHTHTNIYTHTHTHTHTDGSLVSLQDGKCNACAERFCPPGFYFDLCDAFRDSRCLRCTGPKPDNAHYTLSMPFNDDACGWACDAGYERAGAGDVCVACGVGFFSNRVVGKCMRCPFSTTSGGVGSSSCDMCIQGYYRNGISSEGHVRCHLCPSHATTHLSQQGQALTSSECFCGPGFSGYSWHCYPCPTGTYKEGISITPDQILMHNLTQPADLCLPCGAGTFSQATQASDAATCIDCPANSISESGSDECKCAPGYHDQDPSTLASCLPCPENTFNPLIGAVGSELCIPCANVNSYSAEASPSQAACMCNAGYQGDGVNCIPCPTNTYATLTDAVCLSCPAGTEGIDAATSKFDCKCLAGSYGSVAENLPCSACPENADSSLPDNRLVSDCYCDSANGWVGVPPEACGRCPENQYPWTSSRFCSCNAGYYGIPNEDVPCALCPAHSYSASASEKRGECTCLPNWYGNLSEADASCTECPEHSQSLNAISVSECNCNAGYERVVSEQGTPTCEECPAHAFTWTPSQCSCNAGFFLDVNATINTTLAHHPAFVCSPCKTGSYNEHHSQEGEAACEVCPKNSSAMEHVINSTSILNCYCHFGFFRNANLSCSPCPQGTYGLLSATPAVHGNRTQALANTDMAVTHSRNTSDNDTDTQFQATLGSCAACPRNTSTPGSGSTSRDACIPCDPNAISFLQGHPCLCNTGYARKEVSTGCQACDAGSYKPLRSHELALFSPCLPCPGNSTSDPGSGACYCPRDTWGSGVSGICSLCSVNASSSPQENEFSDACKCRAGFYGNGSKCTACPVNSTSFLGSARAALECHCARDFFRTMSDLSPSCNVTLSNVSNVSNVPCNGTGGGKEGGRNTSDYSNSMTAVEGPGTGKSNQSGNVTQTLFQPQCTACPAFSQSPANSKSVADCVCAPGTYGDPSRQIRCRSCGPNTDTSPGATSAAMCFCAQGFYGNPLSAQLCRPCPANSSRTQPAFPTNSTLSDCVCSKGYYGNAFQFSCSPCPAGTFNPHEGAVEAAECLQCGAGNFSQVGATAASDCVPASGLTGASCQINGTCLSR